MTALTRGKTTQKLGTAPLPNFLEGTVLTNVKIFSGALVAVTLAGYLCPAGNASAYRIVGMYDGDSTVDTTGISSGTVTIAVRQCVVKCANSSSTDAITAADIGGMAWAVDDQTVARTSSNGARLAAGRIAQVDSDGVFVEVGVHHTNPGTVDIMLVAAGDLSALGNTFVGIDSTGKAAAASAAGQDCAGVVLNAPAAGAIAIVRVAGIAGVIASTTINPGVRVATTSSGTSKAAVAATTDTTAGSGNTARPVNGSYVMGVALTAGASSTLHQILVQPLGAIPTGAA